MAWWGWLLLAWAVVALLLALGMGAAARTIQREERAANVVQRLAPPTDPSPEAAGAPPAVPRRSRLSVGLRAGPRR